MKDHITAWNAQTPYALQYMHNGRPWALTFFAVDDADAAEKLENLKKSIEILGQIAETIEVKP